AGRGALELADGTVVSKNEFEQVPKSFEGVAGMFDFEFGKLSLIGVKGLDTQAAGLSSKDAEANFYGLTFELKNLPEFLKLAHVHYITEVANARTAPAEQTNRNRIGLTVDGEHM